MRTVLAWAALSALLTSVVADYNINVTNVPDATRSSWCSAEYTACTTLCSSTLNNTCDPTTLLYNCTCTNGSAPGLQYYKNTMPWYLCEEAYAECIQNNANDLTGQNNCKTSIQDNCGTLNLSDFSAASPSSDSKTSATGSATPHSPSATSASDSAASPTKKAVYLGNGVAALAVAVFAAALL
jgi:hypothetical protein